MKNRIVPFLLILSVLVLCGCSDESQNADSNEPVVSVNSITLEDYYSDETAKNNLDEYLDELVDASQGEMTDVYVTISANTFIFHYVLAENIEMETDSDVFSASLQDLAYYDADLIRGEIDGTCVVTDGSSQCVYEVTDDISIGYEYISSDGEVVFSQQFDGL